MITRILKRLCLFTFLLSCFFFTTSAQVVPFHITKSSNGGATSTVKDSAQRSISLLPGFLWEAENSKYYEAKITGILPVPAGTVTIEWPKTRQIVQRDNSNNAWVYIAGTVSDANLTSVNVQATPVQGGTAKSKQLSVSGGSFEGAIQLVGGDYNITITEHMTPEGIKSPAGSSSVNRVGVGEVFMLMGFSYMQGGHPNAYSYAATDERSRTIPSPFFNVNNDNVPDWVNGMQFSYHKIVDNVGPGPDQSWAYGLLGDNLSSRYNVPILIYSGAFGATSIYHHTRNIAGDTGFGSGWFAPWAAKGFPHASIRAIIDKYIPKSGVRAILIHHGGNDRDQIYDFTTNFGTVMNDITSRMGHSSLSAFIALDGPYNSGEPASNPSTGFLNQINNIISGNSNYYPGANVNGYTGSARHNEGLDCGECGHFKDNYTGMSKYEELWRNALPSSSNITNLTFKEADVPAGLKVP